MVTVSVSGYGVCSGGCAVQHSAGWGGYPRGAAGKKKRVVSRVGMRSAGKPAQASEG